MNTDLRQFKTCNRCRALVESQGELFSCALGFKINGETGIPLDQCVKPTTLEAFVEARKHNWKAHKLLGYCGIDSVLSRQIPDARQNSEAGLLLALEFGYKQCERGNNLQMAIQNFKAVRDGREGHGG